VKLGKLRNQRVYLRMSAALVEALETEHEGAILKKPFHLPMIAEPKPVTETGDVGDENVELEVMKKYAHGQKERMGMADIGEVYQAINKLQRTRWRVNADIVFLMRRCWDDGDQVGKLPARDDMPTPAKTWPEGTDPDPKVLTAWKHKAARVHEENGRLVSKRLAMSQKLYLAGKMMAAHWKGEDGLELANPDRGFHFVYTMDWRGRVYPCGGDLTPQADDAGRALLEFAEGKPIGKAGFYWLAVHLANTFGYDKVSLKERVEWVLDHEELITESAVSPLGVDRMWGRADKPWSFLAACQEWAAARVAGPEFITHLPVAVDGSANGLQHFAALMRDQTSAEAVNLVPLEAPADVYQRVADRVKVLLKARLKDDYSKEGMTPDAMYWATEGIDRGLVKRAVMTVPYGVTMYGIRDQLVTEMVKRHGSDDWMPKCAFLAPLVVEAIGDVVSAASVAMDWLKDVAKAAGEADMDVTWETPCGMPVVQEYRKFGSDQVEVWVGGQKKRVRLAFATDVRNRRKEVSGLSPNLIHSLDAAHMMKTVNLTEAEALAMVHDSYATLACDVDELNMALRYAFVRLHEQPLLEMLHAPLSEHYDVPPVPAQGGLSLRDVLDAEYFFA
jgi:DNA-directed RNA polymerase